MNKNVPAVLWRIGALVVAGFCFAGGLFSFAFGPCHDSGGFCSGEFNSTNVEAYAGGIILGSLGAVLALVIFTRRILHLASAALGVAAAVAILAVVVESR